MLSDGSTALSMVQHVYTPGGAISSKAKQRLRNGIHGVGGRYRGKYGWSGGSNSPASLCEPETENSGSET